MGFLKNKKIAITSVSSDAYSETFIKAQVELLPVYLLLHTGWLPHRVNHGDVISKWKKTVNTIWVFFFKKDLFTLTAELVLLLKKEKIEVVLAQYGPGACAMMEVCKQASVDLVAHFHGYDATEKNTLSRYAEEYQKLFKQAKLVIAVSQKMKLQLIELGCPDTKIRVNPCAPQDRFFELKPRYDTNLFLAVGRFVEKKAPHLTIQAFQHVILKSPEARLVMVGDGPLWDTCKTMVQDLGIEDYVSFPGALSHEEISVLMEKSLAFVQHSVVAASGDSEGTPVAVLEASAAGLPVIATKHGGISDVVVSGETGVLVEEHDVQGMAQAMLSLLENRNLAQSMGQAGRERIRNHFSMQHHISTLRSVLNQ